jgi:NhaP-type Na+/H+ or K+/H+ antiporter
MTVFKIEAAVSSSATASPEATPFIIQPSPPQTTEQKYQTVIIVALAVSTLLITVFNRFRPKNWIPDSTITIFCGLLVGFLLGNPNETDLGEEMFTTIFFDICMPPIAFAAALNESRTSVSGVIFAIISTTLSTYLIGQSIEHHFLGDSEAAGCVVKGCMIWGVVMAPVNARYVLTSHDETAHARIQSSSMHETLTFEEEEELEERVHHPLLPTHKKLDSWLHCEALLSGPIAVVFYTSLRQDRLRGLDLDPSQTMLNFARVLLGSVMLGSTIGVFSTLTLRAPFDPKQRGGPYREVSLIVLWAFASFFLARYMNLSAVGTLFCAGIVMKSTAMHVVSHEARYAARVGSEAIATTAEGFVMLYMSIASISLIYSMRYSNDDLHAPLIVLAACTISRLLIAFIVSILLGGGGYRVFTFLVTMLSGLRGAVSFSLALKAGPELRDLLATSAVIAIFCHAIMAPMLALYIDNHNAKKSVAVSSSAGFPPIRVLSSRGVQYDSINRA